MPLVPFSTQRSAPSWVGLLTYAGYLLGENYELVDEYLGPVSKIVLVLIVAFVVWVKNVDAESKARCNRLIYYVNDLTQTERRHLSRANSTYPVYQLSTQKHLKLIASNTKISFWTSRLENAL